MMRKPAPFLLLLLIFLLCFSEFPLFTLMVSAAHSKEFQGEAISEKLSGGGRGGGGGVRGGGSAGGMPKSSGSSAPGYKSRGHVPLIVGAGAAGAAGGAAAGSRNHHGSAMRGRGGSHSSTHLVAAFGFVILALV